MKDWQAVDAQCLFSDTFWHHDYSTVKSEIPPLIALDGQWDTARLTICEQEHSLQVRTKTK